MAAFRPGKVCDLYRFFTQIHHVFSSRFYVCKTHFCQRKPTSKTRIHNKTGTTCLPFSSSSITSKYPLPRIQTLFRGANFSLQTQFIYYYIMQTSLFAANSFCKLFLPRKLSKFPANYSFLCINDYGARHQGTQILIRYLGLFFCIFSRLRCRKRDIGCWSCCYSGVFCRNLVFKIKNQIRTKSDSG